jgi:hypothetical protein
MRRPLIFALAAAGILAMSAVPAAQASTVHAVTHQAVITAHAHQGVSCRTVHEPGSSTVTGTICLMVNTYDLCSGCQGQALISFSSSKTLESVFVEHLKYTWNGQVVKSVTNVTKNFSGTSNYISTGFFYGGANQGTGQAQALDACMWWSNGAGVCTAGSSYWFSGAVLI